MTKCEVVFDGDEILIKDYSISASACNDGGTSFDIVKDDMLIKSYDTIEEAIEYCLEN